MPMAKLQKSEKDKHQAMIHIMDRVMLPDDNVSATLKISLAGIIYLLADGLIMFRSDDWLLVCILIQGQMIVSVYLALRYIRSGYMTALGLNIVAAVQEIRLLVTNQPNARFFLIFYIDVILAVSLIAYYARRSHKIYREALRQKEEISAAYYQAAVSEEQLWKKNRELESSNQVISRDKQEMYRLANIDPLTQLPNRRMFQRKLDEIGKEAKEQNRSFALVFIDLDNFKNVNDTLGHQAGDELIRYMAFNLSRLTHTADMLGYFGGDEFVLIIRRALQKEKILSYIRRLAVMLKKPAVLGNMKIAVSASFGIAIFPQDSSHVSELLRFADSAMYQSKRDGKNRIRFFEKSLLDDLMNETRLVQGLKSAIQNEELSLVLQPQYFAEGGELRGFEVLIRWESPRFGFVSPMRFIQLAEKNGMILQIGEWVLKQACLVMKGLEGQYSCSVKLAVNVSAVQAMEPDFVETVARILNETGFDPHHLEIEITETAFSNSMNPVHRMIAGLHELGVVVALDDFGTGYSSLSYLQQLPFDLVKIDKTFIDKIGLDLQSNQFVSTIISMVHQMNIPVLAEGVETEQQRDFLRLKDCDLIQGYLYGKPMPVSSARELLDRLKNKATKKSIDQKNFSAKKD